MGAYIYTTRAEVKTTNNGEKVARLSFAYKDFGYDAPASWFRSAVVQEAAGSRAAAKHNANGVKLLARCDKFEDGAPVMRVTENGMRGNYNDYNFGNMEEVGVLRKNGRKWYVEYK